MNNLKPTKKKKYGEVEGGGKTDRQLLWTYWARPKNWFIYQPIHIVRRYYGEKLAFYFSWLGFYTTWLVLPSIVGFFVFIYGAITVIWDVPTYILSSSDNFKSSNQNSL
jgi:hypothetical protein